MFYLYKFSLNIILNFIVFTLNFFIKRDKNIILFGSWMGETFSDNSRYLFQYMHKSSDKKVIWVTRNNEILKELNNLGYRAYNIHSLHSYYYHLKSGTHVVCNVPFKTKSYKGDILGELSLGAKKIQLWHGIPLKGIGRIAKNNDYNRDNTLLNKIIEIIKSNRFFNNYIKVSGDWNNYCMLATNNRIGEIFSEAFSLSSTNIIISSYPRNCECLELVKSEELILGKMSDTKKKVLLFVPTFRETNSIIPNPIQNDNFRKFLKENNVIWVQKKHMADKKNNIDSFVDIETIMLPETFDLNVLTPKIDILITDYSSISFDFIFFNKPVHYYVPDINNYISEERGFSLDFDDYTAGWISMNLNELKKSIEKQLNDKTDITNIDKKVQQVKNKVYDNSQPDYFKIAKDLFGFKR